MGKKEKEQGVNWTKFINDLLRPENRKLLFIYVVIFGIILLVFMTFLKSFFILIVVFALIFGSGILSFFKKESRKK